MIFPLDAEGTIYVAQDEQGESIGTGTREVCEALIYIVNRARELGPLKQTPVVMHSNVRAAIII